MGPTYWTVSVGSWDGSKYTSSWAGIDKIDLFTTGTGWTGFRPTKMRITMGVLPTGINDLWLYDAANNPLIADSDPGLVAFGSVEFDISSYNEPNDINELLLHEFSGFNTFEITNIEFL
jgi:hypothetical protein